MSKVSKRLSKEQVDKVNDSKELSGIEQVNDVEKALSGHGFNTNAAGCDDVVGIGSGILIGTAIVAFILPVVSIYFWIVVNSLR